MRNLEGGKAKLVYRPSRMVGRGAAQISFVVAHDSNRAVPLKVARLESCAKQFRA
jgi:hypothetical protein